VAHKRAYHRQGSTRNSSIRTQNKCRLPSLSDRLVECELSVESLSSSVSLWPVATTPPPSPSSSSSSAAAFGIKASALAASLEPLAAAVCVIYKQRQYTNTEREKETRYRYREKKGALLMDDHELDGGKLN